MRPKRVYKQNGKYYYIINGKKKFIRTPKKLSDKQVININIKTGNDYGRKLKKRKRRKTMKYTKKLIPDMTERATSAVINYPQQNIQFLPATLYQPKKNIESLSEKIELQTKMLNDDKKEKDKKETLLMIKDEVKKELDNVKKITNILNDEDEDEDKSSIDIIPIIEKWAMIETNKKYSQKDFNIYLKKENIEYNTKTKAFKDIFIKVVENIKNKNKEEIKEKKTLDLDLIKKSINVYLDIVWDKIKNDESYLSRSGAEKGVVNIYAENIFNYKSFKQYLKDMKEEDVIKYVNTYNDKIRDLYNKLFSEFKKSTQKGNGIDDKGGLWNTDIEKIVKAKIDNIVPVIANDEGSKLLPYIKKNMKSFSFIINRVNSDNDGTGDDGQPTGHWISVFINNADDFQSCEIYDSLAETPSTELIKLCKKLCKMINPEYNFKLKINHLKNQSNTTDTCGYHAIKFLEDRNNGVSWCEATGYDKYIENMKPNNENEGEEKINNVVSDYNLYL